jgi:hypothetical protein
MVFNVTLRENRDVPSHVTMSRNRVSENSVKQTSSFARRKLLTEELLLILETGCIFVWGTLIVWCGAHKFMDPSNSVVAVSNSAPAMVV